MQTAVVGRLRFIVTTILLTVCTAGISIASPAAPEAAQLVLYLEVTAASEVDVTLDRPVVFLAGVTDTLEVPLLLSVFDSRALGGTQIRLAEAEMPRGRFDALICTFEGLSGRVGRAPVTPADPPRRVILPLDLELQPRRASFLRLRWVPRPLDASAVAYAPDLQLVPQVRSQLGSQAFVTNEQSGNVSVIEKNTLRVIDTIYVGDSPRGMAYSPGDQMLYVAVSGTSELAVVDVVTNEVVKRVPLLFGDEPSRLEISLSGLVLYVLNRGSGTLAMLSLVSLQEMNRVSVGERPLSLTVDQRSGFAFVTGELSSDVLVVDPESGSVVSRFTAESFPAEILIDQNEQQLFLSGKSRARLQILDSSSGQSVSRVSVCSPATGLAFQPQSRRLYAAAGSCREITIVHADRALEMGSISLPGRPGLMTFDAEYRRLFVTLSDENRIAICNVNTNRLVGLVEVGRRPYTVVVP